MESVPVWPRDVALAITDLATRLGVAADEIEVVSHVEMEWPDASVGCPQPGMRYAQVLTNGTLTVLSVAGTEYRYHAGGRRPPFLCETSS